MEEEKNEISGENLLSILWLNDWFLIDEPIEKFEESKADNSEIDKAER